VSLALVALLLFAEPTDAEPDTCSLRCTERQQSCASDCTTDDEHCATRCSERMGDCQRNCDGAPKAAAAPKAKPAAHKKAKKPARRSASTASTKS
jgi:hypothetical protein